MCQAPAQNVCGSGYTWDAGIDKCVTAVVCPDNGAFNPVADRSEKLAQNECPVDYAYDADPASPTYDRCVTSATCADGGSYTADHDRCEKTWMPTCNSVNGYVYNVQTGVCQRTPTCTYGAYNATYNLCVQPIIPSCPGGYSCNISRARCEKAPECPTGTTYNVVTNKCDAITSAGTQQVLSCTPQAFLCTPYASPCCNVSITCPDGPQGKVSVAANYCCLGADALTINSPLDLLTRTELSSTGFALSALQCNSVGNCNYYFIDRYCADGSPASNWILSANLCFSAPVCANGAYDAALNVCQASLTRNCGAYSWSPTDFKCLQPVACPRDPMFSQAATTQFSTTLDTCVSEVQHDCPAGTTYTPLPIGRCEAVPICNGAGIYNPQKDSCFEGFNTCPLGTQYACMEYQSKMHCSPNACFDPGAPGSEVTTTLDEAMLQDDGPRDANGQCLGQLYIFNGKASRCRPPGLKVGMINNCCKSDKVSSEDTGASVQAAVQGIQMAYEIGQVAYYGNALATGAAQISAISTTATGAVTSMSVVTATGTTTTLSGAAATGAYAGMASGATGASAMSAGIQAYASALLNPATIAVAIVIMVVMKVLMGSGCDQGDIQTGMQDAAKDCHYVGDYCCVAEGVRKRESV